MEIIHRQDFENSFCLKNFLKIVWEIFYTALNGCRLDDLILAYAGIEYPKIGFVLRADDVILVKNLMLKMG